MITFDNFFDLGFPYSGLVALPLICILAEMSWRAIESPLIGYAKRRFAPAPRSGVISTAGAV